MRPVFAVCTSKSCVMIPNCTRIDVLAQHLAGGLLMLSHSGHWKDLLDVSLLMMDLTADGRVIGQAAGSQEGHHRASCSLGWCAFWPYGLENLFAIARRSAVPPSSGRWAPDLQSHLAYLQELACSIELWAACHVQQRRMLSSMLHGPRSSSGQRQSVGDTALWHVCAGGAASAAAAANATAAGRPASPPPRGTPARKLLQGRLSSSSLGQQYEAVEVKVMAYVTNSSVFESLVGPYASV